VVSILKPRGIKVVAAMPMVRNSVGENCYVSDEVVVSRTKLRVRVGNTDAEGRMIMADVLCKVWYIL
jgi:leucyl aminopeptidase